MTRQEFNRMYLEAVHKCALGIHIIRLKGPELGIDEDTMLQNEFQLISMLSNGVGVSVDSVANDVRDQVDAFDQRFFNRPEVKRIMGGMIGQMKTAGLLSQG